MYPGGVWLRNAEGRVGKTTMMSIDAAARRPEHNVTNEKIGRDERDHE